jgi:hypothetical protein
LWEYFNRSHTHEYGNWDRAVPFVGIFVSNFRYTVFAVHVCHSEQLYGDLEIVGEVMEDMQQLCPLRQLLQRSPLLRPNS